MPNRYSHAVKFDSSERPASRKGGQMGRREDIWEDGKRVAQEGRKEVSREDGKKGQREEKIRFGTSNGQLFPCPVVLSFWAAAP